MPIKGVVYDERGKEHEDARRVLSIVHNGSDYDGFTTRQVKVAKVKEDSTLGSHFHHYRELLHLYEGEATVDLMDTATKETDRYVMKEMSTILIPAFVAHKVALKKGSILIGCSEEEFVSPEVNLHPCDF